MWGERRGGFGQVVIKECGRVGLEKRGRTREGECESIDRDYLKMKISLLIHDCPRKDAKTRNPLKTVKGDGERVC